MSFVNSGGGRRYKYTEDKDDHCCADSDLRHCYSIFFNLASKLMLDYQHTCIQGSFH